MKRELLFDVCCALRLIVDALGVFSKPNAQVQIPYVAWPDGIFPSNYFRKCGQVWRSKSYASKGFPLEEGSPLSGHSGQGRRSDGFFAFKVEGNAS